jgi:hypothetical protein
MLPLLGKIQIKEESGKAVGILECTICMGEKIPSLMTSESCTTMISTTALRMEK